MMLMYCLGVAVRALEDTPSVLQGGRLGPSEGVSLRGPKKVRHYP